MQRIKLTEDTEVDPNGHALHVGGIIFDNRYDNTATAYGGDVLVLESIARTDRTLEPIKDTILDVTEELKALRAERDAWQADAKRYKDDYLGACDMVAAMHKAAVGEARGPTRGVVEDVEDLRTALEIMTTSDTFFRKAAKEAIDRAERLEKEIEDIRQRAKAWSDAAIEGLRTISRLVSEEG